MLVISCIKRVFFFFPSSSLLGEVFNIFVGNNTASFEPLVADAPPPFDSARAET